jgi:hypothetical protein
VSRPSTSLSCFGGFLENTEDAATQAVAHSGSYELMQSYIERQDIEYFVESDEFEQQIAIRQDHIEMTILSSKVMKNNHVART